MDGFELPNKERFRPDEVAKYLDMSVKTIYSWIATGKMNAIRTGGRALRIPREEIIKIQEPSIS